MAEEKKLTNCSLRIDVIFIFIPRDQWWEISLTTLTVYVWPKGANYHYYYYFIFRFYGEVVSIHGSSSFARSRRLNCFRLLPSFYFDINNINSYIFVFKYIFTRKLKENGILTRESLCNKKRLILTCDIRLNFAFNKRIAWFAVGQIYNVKEEKEKYIIAKPPKSTKFICPGERRLDLPTQGD